MVAARFLARPQRFLASVELAEGEQTLAYCANPGSFHGCLETGSHCLLWDSGNVARKRRYTLGAIKLGKTWLGTDTHLANELVHHALKNASLPSFAGCEIVKREPRYEKLGRLDFELESAGRKIFVEVKSATVVEAGVARFPDSVSPRAVLHLKQLTKLVKKGHRAALVFLIQRGDAERMKIDLTRDPLFGRAVKAALRAGVEVVAVRHPVTPSGFGWPSEVPVEI